MLPTSRGSPCLTHTPSSFFSFFFACSSVKGQHCLFCFIKEIVPTHLITSPITTEEAVLRGREGRFAESGMGNSQPLGPEDPSARNMQASSNTAGKKRKRRRKRHKTEARKEEQTTPAGGEVEKCDLSSDEETHSQWLVCDWLNIYKCKY